MTAAQQPLGHVVVSSLQAAALGFLVGLVVRSWGTEESALWIVLAMIASEDLWANLRRR